MPISPSHRKLAVILAADIVGYGAENNYRIRWKTAMSSECPWYVHEVPTVMVSLNYTTHLHDATMVKCYINAYHSNEEIVRQVLTVVDDEGTEVLSFGPVDQYECQADAFGRAVRSGTAAPTPLTDAVANMAVIDAVFASAADGSWHAP